MSHSALMTLRPNTIALLKAFKARRAELPRGELHRQLLCLGRKTFRNAYPRQIRPKVIARYCVGCH